MMGAGAASVSLLRGVDSGLMGTPRTPHVCCKGGDAITLEPRPEVPQAQDRRGALGTPLWGPWRSGAGRAGAVSAPRRDRARAACVRPARPAPGNVDKQPAAPPPVSSSSSRVRAPTRRSSGLTVGAA